MATATAPQATATAAPFNDAKPPTLPLFDLALDLPHPATTTSTSPSDTTLITPPDIGGSDPKTSPVTNELSQEQSITRIARFAFPEYDDRVPPPPQSDGGSGLNRFDVYLQSYASRSSQVFTFALQLSSGQRVHGHVRRYLPPHAESATRNDVGRRGVRALIVLTRINGGGGELFDAVLRTAEMLLVQNVAVRGSLPKGDEEPMKKLLHVLYVEHAKRVAITAAAAGANNAGTNQQNQGMVNLPGIEFGKSYMPTMKLFDTTRFYLSNSVLQQSGVSDAGPPILPLLRRLGPSHTLRLLSALLCERRIIFTSKSPARLSACCGAVTAILSQGVCSWQHVYVPIVPPHLLHHLAAPVPYVVGLPTQYLNELGKVPGGIGQVITVDVDVPNGGALQVYGVEQPNSYVPDLLRGGISDDQFVPPQPQANAAVDGTSTPNPYNASIAERLATDLADVLKSDVRASTANSTAADAVVGAGTQALQEAAGKAIMVMSALKKLKKKGSTVGAAAATVQRQASMESTGDVEDAVDEVGSVQQPEGEADELSSNPRGEEDARVAFVTFFVCLLGDPATFLSQPRTGAQQQQQPMQPAIDREKFIHERKRRGEYEGTPLYSVLVKFVQSQIFEQHGKARIAELLVARQQPQRQPQPNRPLFTIVCEAIRRQGMDYNPVNVRRIVRQASSSPGTNPGGKQLLKFRERARTRALTLTSKQVYPDGNAASDLAQLTEACRDVSGPLEDVVGVVWMRVRDSRGMNSRHALLALIVLRNLVLHGPLAAVADAAEGIDKVRALKSYSNKLSGSTAGQIRGTAAQVYELLVDRSKLFAQRRACADRRRQMYSPRTQSGGRKRLVRDGRLKFSLKFRQVHALVVAASGGPGGGAGGPPSANATPPEPQHDLLVFSPDAASEAPATAAGGSTRELLNFDNAALPEASKQPQPQAEPPKVNGAGGNFDMLDMMNAAAATSASASGETEVSLTAASSADGDQGSIGGTSGQVANPSSSYDPFTAGSVASSPAKSAAPTGGPQGSAASSPSHGIGMNESQQVSPAHSTASSMASSAAQQQGGGRGAVAAQPSMIMTQQQQGARQPPQAGVMAAPQPIQQYGQRDHSSVLPQPTVPQQNWQQQQQTAPNQPRPVMQSGGPQRQTVGGYPQNGNVMQNQQQAGTSQMNRQQQQQQQKQQQNQQQAVALYSQRTMNVTQQQQQQQGGQGVAAGVGTPQRQQQSMGSYPQQAPQQQQPQPKQPQQVGTSYPQPGMVGHRQQPLQNKSPQVTNAKWTQQQQQQPKQPQQVGASYPQQGMVGHRQQPMQNQPPQVANAKQTQPMASNPFHQGMGGQHQQHSPMVTQKQPVMGTSSSYPYQHQGAGGTMQQASKVPVMSGQQQQQQTSKIPVMMGQQQQPPQKQMGYGHRPQAGGPGNQQQIAAAGGSQQYFTSASSMPGAHPGFNPQQSQQQHPGQQNPFHQQASNNQNGAGGTNAQRRAPLGSFDPMARR